MILWYLAYGFYPQGGVKDPSWDAVLMGSVIGTLVAEAGLEPAILAYETRRITIFHTPRYKVSEGGLEPPQTFVHTFLVLNRILILYYPYSIKFTIIFPI